MSSDCDVIVIGSGAGGGTLVHELAPSGKRILAALTAMANALRVGDHLLERMGARQSGQERAHVA